MIKEMLKGRNSDPERSTEGPATIKAGRSVVVHEDMAEATIGKDGAPEFSNIGWSLQPALRFCVELPKLLRRAILFFR